MLVLINKEHKFIRSQGLSWSWSYGSWIYNYLRNQYLSPLKLWVQIPPRWGLLDTTLCDEGSRWLPADQWFSTGTPVSSTNKCDHHDITEILLKVVLNTITLTHSCSLFLWEIVLSRLLFFCFFLTFTIVMLLLLFFSGSSLFPENPFNLEFSVYVLNNFRYILSIK